MLGPDGGDGGKGGDIIIVADQSIRQLRGIKKSYKAQDGGNGQVDYCKGKKGKDFIIKVVYLLDSYSIHIKLVVLDSYSTHASNQWFNVFLSNKKIGNNFLLHHHHHHHHQLVTPLLVDCLHRFLHATLSWAFCIPCVACLLLNLVPPTSLWFASGACFLSRYPLRRDLSPPVVLHSCYVSCPLAFLFHCCSLFTYFH